MNILFIDSGNKILPPTFIKSQKESLINNNINVKYYSIIGKGVIGYLSNIISIRKMIKKEQIDIIHAHYVFAGILALLSFTGKYIVISFMGSDLYGTVNKKGKFLLRGRINYFLSKAIQPFVSKIIVKSYSLSKYIYLKYKMSIIPNGVDFTFFKPINKLQSRAKLNLEPEKKYVLFVADKKNPRKNYALLNKAMEYILDDNLEIMDIDYPFPYELMPNLLNAANVIVLTSYLEGSPNVIKEALACNVPIVSVDVGDVKENIKDIDGCYLSSYEPEDLSEKIMMAINHGKRTNSRDNIQHLEINNIAKQIIAIYTNILKRSNGN